MLTIVLIFSLVIALLSFPRWSWSRDWGYIPTAGAAAVAAAMLFLLLFSDIRI